MALDNSVQSPGQWKGEDKVQWMKGLCLTRVVPFFKSFSGSPLQQTISFMVMLPSKKPGVRVPGKIYGTFHSTQTSGKPQALFCVSMDDSCGASWFCLFGVDLVSLTCEDVYFFSSLFIRLHQVLVAAQRIFDLHCSRQDIQLRDANSYLQHVGPSSLVIEPGFPALGAQSFTHWTTREVPEMIHFKWKTHSPRYQRVLINGTEFKERPTSVRTQFITQLALQSLC